MSDEYREYNRKYRQEHKEEKKTLDKEWKNKNKKYVLEYNRKWYAKNRERLLVKQQKYRDEHKEYIRKRGKIWRDKNPNYDKERNERRKLRVFNFISNGNPHCVSCGCDDLRLLEINHKNGGGTKERKNGTNPTLYNSILNRKRGIDDLEILCRVCNARHYLELKYGNLPYKISYSRIKEKEYAKDYQESSE